MPRSLRVRQDWIGQVKLSVRRNGFLSQQALAEELGLARSTVVNFLTGKPVDRAVFEEICLRLSLNCQEISQSITEIGSKTADPAISTSSSSQPSTSTRIDWGEAIDVTRFYGRTVELQTLHQWILQEGYRLIALLGMGGIGKTALSVKLAEQVQSEFQLVIWRSLRSAPLLDEILTDLLQFLSNQQVTALPLTPEGKISLLLTYLQQQRCLVVLDNFEAVLESDMQAGGYKVGYEGYGELLRQVGETKHQSYLVLTSREKPREVANLEGVHSTVRSLLVKGLSPSDGRMIFQDKDCTGLNETVCQLVVNHYAGNPLALKIAASAVQELFAGQVDALVPLLQEGKLKFRNVTDLLERQFNRLTSPEQHIFYWLCVNREPSSLAELENDIVAESIKRRILDVLTSLVRRSLVERNNQGWFLQPVVLEYITEQFIDRICHEITEQEPNLFKSHALVKATAKDYVRQAQFRLILEPIVHDLIDRFGNQKSIEFYLNQILAQLRQKPELPPNYAAGNLLNLFCHLQTDITGYDFSNLKIRQAYLQNANLPAVNLSGTDLSFSVFADLFSGVVSLAFSPDSKLLATGDSRCEIQIWEVESGKLLQTLSGHQSWVWSMVFSPDSQLLVSGSDNYSIRVWNWRTAECLQTRKGPANLLNAIDFGDSASGEPNGHSITIAGRNSEVWNPAALVQQIESLQGQSFLIRSIAYSPDGRLLALSQQGTETQAYPIYLYDIQTGACEQIFSGHHNFARLLKFSSDGTMLASSDYAQETNQYRPEVRIWNVKTGACLLTLQGHTRLINDLVFDPDAQWLATASSDETIKLWDLRTGECVKTFLGHSNRVLSIAFLSDGQLLASGGDDRSVKLWDIQTGRCLRTFQGYTNAIYSMSLLPNRQVFATAHEDESIKLWNLETGGVFKVLRGHTNRVWCVAFANQSNRDFNYESQSCRTQQARNLLASGSADYSVKLWDWKTGQCLKTLRGHANWIWSVVFSPSAAQLVSASYDRTLKLWDVQTGRCLKTFQEQSSASMSVLFSADGQQLLSSDYSGRVSQWDVQTGNRLHSWQAHEGRIFKIALHPTQFQCATGGDDQQIKLWDLQTGQCLQTLQGHQSAITDLRFIDNRRLISASFDQTIRIWDITLGTCVQVLEGHQSIISSIAYDRLLLSSGMDATLRQWDLETGNCLQTLITPRPYEGMNIANAIGLTEAERTTLKWLGAVDSIETI
ncbi:NB-ARC domain-containing protein [Leptolyngbya sp. DQ-M1]|uniref:NB-ARC domain-containing protein n=1 Tax=Leptolyngbya sp. DQ-M1 TaxID=2933920 RepID=UPI003299F23A